MGPGLIMSICALVLFSLAGVLGSKGKVEWLSEDVSEEDNQILTKRSIGFSMVVDQPQFLPQESDSGQQQRAKRSPRRLRKKRLQDEASSGRIGRAAKPDDPDDAKKKEEEEKKKKEEEEEKKKKEEDEKKKKEEEEKAKAGGEKKTEPDPKDTGKVDEKKKDDKDAKPKDDTKAGDTPKKARPRRRKAPPKKPRKCWRQGHKPCYKKKKKADDTGKTDTGKADSQTKTRRKREIRTAENANTYGDRVKNNILQGVPASSDTLRDRKTEESSNKLLGTSVDVPNFEKSSIYTTFLSGQVASLREQMKIGNRAGVLYIWQMIHTYKYLTDEFNKVKKSQLHSMQEVFTNFVSGACNFSDAETEIMESSNKWPNSASLVGTPLGVIASQIQTCDARTKNLKQTDNTHMKGKERITRAVGVPFTMTSDQVKRMEKLIVLIIHSKCKEVSQQLLMRSALKIFYVIRGVKNLVLGPELRNFIQAEVMINKLSRCLRKSKFENRH